MQHNDLPWELHDTYANRTLDLATNVSCVGRARVGARARLSDATRARARAVRRRSAATGLDTDFVRAAAGGLRGQFWSVWTPCEVSRGRRGAACAACAARRRWRWLRDAAQAGYDSLALAVEQIDRVKQMAARYGGALQFAASAADERRAFAGGKLASFIGMEGGHMINNSLALLRQFHALGVRYLTLTHFCSTGWAEMSGNERLAPPLPAAGLAAAPRLPPYAAVVGLTAFGRDVVREMNRLGMLVERRRAARRPAAVTGRRQVDLSHVSARTMHDALDVSLAPVPTICCARAYFMFVCVCVCVFCCCA